MTEVIPKEIEDGLKQLVELDFLNRFVEAQMSLIPDLEIIERTENTKTGISSIFGDMFWTQAGLFERFRLSLEFANSEYENFIVRSHFIDKDDFDPRVIQGLLNRSLDKSGQDVAHVFCAKVPSHADLYDQGSCVIIVIASKDQWERMQVDCQETPISSEEKWLFDNDYFQGGGLDVEFTAGMPNYQLLSEFCTEWVARLGKASNDPSESGPMTMYFTKHPYLPKLPLFIEDWDPCEEEDEDNDE